MDDQELDDLQILDMFAPECDEEEQDDTSYDDQAVYDARQA